MKGAAWNPCCISNHGCRLCDHDAGSAAPPIDYSDDNICRILSVAGLGCGGYRQQGHFGRPPVVRRYLTVGEVVIGILRTASAAIAFPFLVPALAVAATVTCDCVTTGFGGGFLTRSSSDHNQSLTPVPAPLSAALPLAVAWLDTPVPVRRSAA